MRYTTITLLCLILLNIMACQRNSTSYPISYNDSLEIDSETKNSDFMVLYYGMEKNANGYTLKDSILDSTPCLIGHNYSDSIFYNEDNCKARVSLGLYMDEAYPNSIVQTSIEKTVDSLICTSLGYYKEDIDEFLNNKPYPSDSIENFFNFWESVFHQIIASSSDIKSDFEYCNRLEARVCVLSHKIYEDSVWVTYIIESSVDYHGSCGCPSQAEYISYNKENGAILTIQDVLQHYPDVDFKSLLWSKYEQSAYENGICPNNHYSTSLIDYADGAAYTKHGMLFYFMPYKIGGGAEGQYNLIIQL